MENNKNKKSVKFQGDMLNFCDFIQVFVFTTNHHLKAAAQGTDKKRLLKTGEPSIQVQLHCILVQGTQEKVAAEGRWSLNRGNHMSRFDCSRSEGIVKIIQRLFFLILIENICCDPSLESSQ